MRKLSFNRVAICLAFLISLSTYAMHPVDISRQTKPSVVTVYCEDGSFGSGFFVSKNEVLTNAHVFKTGNRGYLMFDSHPTKVNIKRVIKFDERLDLSLLSVEDQDVVPLELDSTQAESGQDVYAFGSPEGHFGSMSDGMVSTTREKNGVTRIQHTAPVSHGSSGGPLVNSDGKVVGVNVSMLKSGQNINFAIPISYFIDGFNRSIPPIRNINFQYQFNNTVPAAINNELNGKWYIKSIQIGQYFEDQFFWASKYNPVQLEFNSHNISSQVSTRGAISFCEVSDDPDYFQSSSADINATYTSTQDGMKEVKLQVASLFVSPDPNYRPIKNYHTVGFIKSWGNPGVPYLISKNGNTVTLTSKFPVTSNAGITGTRVIVLSQL